MSNELCIKYCEIMMSFEQNRKFAMFEFSQLVSASYSDGYVYGYGFDKIGNRMFASLMEKGTEKFKTDFEYNGLNQIASQEFEYDRYGNLTKSKDSEYSYDLHNRLIEVKKPNVSVKYDALGQRIKSEETVSASTMTTTFLMSGMVEQARMVDNKAMFHTLGLDLASSLTATGAVGAVLSSTTYNLPLPLGEGKGEGVMSQHYLFDGNGNVIAATDSSGAITAKLAYSPFGELLSGSDANLPFTFSTKAVDASGLSYYGFRFYTSKLGRWTSRDPIYEQGGQNAYQIASNNLIFEIDSLGLKGYTNTFSSPELEVYDVDGNPRDWEVDGEPTVFFTAWIFLYKKQYYDSSDHKCRISNFFNQYVIDRVNEKKEYGYVKITIYSETKDDLGTAINVITPLIWGIDIYYTRGWVSKALYVIRNAIDTSSLNVSIQDWFITTHWHTRTRYRYYQNPDYTYEYVLSETEVTCPTDCPDTDLNGDLDPNKLYDDNGNEVVPPEMN